MGSKGNMFHIITMSVPWVASLFFYFKKYEVFGKLLIFISVLLELLERRRPDGVVRTEERQGVNERVRDVLKLLEHNKKIVSNIGFPDFCS